MRTFLIVLGVVGVLLTAFYFYGRSFHQSVRFTLRLPHAERTVYLLEEADIEPVYEGDLVVLTAKDNIIHVPEELGFRKKWIGLGSAKTLDGAPIPVENEAPFPKDVVALRGLEFRNNEFYIIVGTAADRDRFRKTGIMRWR